MPPITTPPPTPVPSVSITRSSSPTMCASASAAQFASLSTNTGTPKRAPSSSRTACSRPSSSASAFAITGGCSTAGAASTPSTAATATFVPPTSTPRTTSTPHLRKRGPASFADYAASRQSASRCDQPGFSLNARRSVPACRGRYAKFRDGVGGVLDAKSPARADACSMLISQTTRFAELQSRIHGRVLTEADETWNASRQTFNLTHDQRPAALVRVANADDVAETVRYAAQRGLRV